MLLAKVVVFLGVEDPSEKKSTDGTESVLSEGSGLSTLFAVGVAVAVAVVFPLVLRDKDGGSKTVDLDSKSAMAGSSSCGE